MGQSPTVPTVISDSGNRVRQGQCHAQGHVAGKWKGCCPERKGGPRCRAGHPSVGSSPTKGAAQPPPWPAEPHPGAIPTRPFQVANEDWTGHHSVIGLIRWPGLPRGCGGQMLGPMGTGQTASC